MFVCPYCGSPITVSLWTFFPVDNPRMWDLYGVECDYCTRKSYVPRAARWVGLVAGVLSAALIGTLSRGLEVKVGKLLYWSTSIALVLLVGCIASRLATRSLEKE